METMKKLWKTKTAKIGVAAVCIVAVLAAAFIFQPGPKKDAVYDTPYDWTATDESGLPVSNTPEVNLLNTESGIEVNAPTATADGGNSGAASSSSAQTVTSTPGMDIDPGAGKDKYLTDPVPEGKPVPVEPENVTVDKNKKYTCTLSIRCDTILNNMNMFNKDKLGVLPQDGTILLPTTVTFYENESVFDVLKRVTREKRIHMEFVFTPMYNSVYIEGIHNLYEFDCGSLSGWMYKVNGWFPNYGASRYVLKQGDVIEWAYTCDLGKDVGGYYAVGGG